eukprot:gene26458-32459_t
MGDVKDQMGDVKDQMGDVKDQMGDVKDQTQGDVENQMGDVKEHMEDVKDQTQGDVENQMGDIKDQMEDEVKNVGEGVQDQTQDVTNGLQNKVGETQNQLQSAAGSDSKSQAEERSDFLDSWQFSRLHSLLCQSEDLVSMLRKALPMLDLIWTSEFQKSLDKYKAHKLAAQTEQPGVCNTDSATVHCRNANVGSTAFSVLMLILMFALFFVFIMLAGAILGISYGINEVNTIGFQYLSVGQEGLFNLALAVEHVSDTFNSTLHSVFARLSDTEADLNATFTAAMATMGPEILGTNKTNDPAAYLVSMMSLHAANFLANNTNGTAHTHSAYVGRPFQHSAKVLTQVMSTCERIEPRDVLTEFSEDDDLVDFSNFDTSSSQVPYLEAADGSLFEYVNGSLFSLPNATLDPNTSFLLGVSKSIVLVLANTSFGNISMSASMSASQDTSPELVSNHSTIFFSDGSRVQVPNGAAVKLPNRTILPPLEGSVVHLPAGGSYMLPNGTHYKVIGSSAYRLLRGEETPTSEGKEVTKLSDMKPSGLARQVDTFAEGGSLPHVLLDSAMGNVLGVSLFTSLLDALGIPLSLFQQMDSTVTHVLDQSDQVKDVVGDVMGNQEGLTDVMGDVKDQVEDQMGDVKDQMGDVKDQ